MRRTRVLSAAAAGALLLGLVLRAGEAAAGARAGLRLAGETALPALFPFFVVGALMVRTGLSSALGRVLARPFRAVYGLPGAGAAALVLGLLGGYPVGAQVTVSLYRAGQLTRDEAERLLCFVSCTGPAFLISMCGTACGGMRAGVQLYLIHAAAALLTGLALARGRERSPEQARPAPAEDLAPALVGAVADGASAAIKVTAFIVFFSALLPVAGSLGLLPTLSTLLAPVLTFLGVPSGAREGFTVGLIELTNGLCRLRGLAPREAIPLFSALVAFGGLSVHCQTLSVLAEEGLSARGYLCGKCVHALLAWALASVWLGWLLSA